MTIALYATAVSSQITPPYDFDSPIVRGGGLSSLFSSSSSSTSFPLPLAAGSEDHLPSISIRGEDLSSSSSSSSFSSYSRGDHSPVSVFQAPLSSTPPPIIIIRSFSPPAAAQRDGGKRLFNNNSFVTHALSNSTSTSSSSSSSCVEECDYDSQVHDHDDEEEELTLFLMDDSSDTTTSSSSSSKENTWLLDAQLKHPIFNHSLVIKAFYEAQKAHTGQMRATGDPYLQHCLETAILLATIGANPTVVAAGLLHDTLDDSFITYDYLLQTFGPGVAHLVQGVSKLSHLSKLARESNTANKTMEADRLHTMFLAMADARAVLIKLADRLHNMITLEALPLSKKQRFAKETMEIFVPLANRLGITSWKEQLENLCFKYLDPQQHNDLSAQLLKSFDEAMVTSAAEKLELSLQDESIPYHVLYGRHKSLYSVYCKMLKKKLTMDEIHDIHGLRLIVENEEDCYKVLQLVHQLWPEVSGKFKDYIKQPKRNGYQSLHTVVMGEGSVPLEVQIRTKSMHSQAEYGFAAHWRYKEDDCKHSSFVLQVVEWARWVVTWQCESMGQGKSCIEAINPPCTFPFHSEDCPHSYKPCDGPVYVIMIENDKMSVQEFPPNSRVKDVVRLTGQGNWRYVKEELRPRVNREPISDPNCKLKMGDVIELTPRIRDESLTAYREEIQRMYERGHGISSRKERRPGNMVVGWGL